MTFEEVLDQALEMLRRRGRVTYRALQRQFSLDDAYLADLKAEIIEAQRLAVDENGTVLVWTGGPDPAAIPPSAQPEPLRATLTNQTALATTAPVAPGSSDAERRQLTVMFCDLVDSTALSSRLDLEDLREVVRAYQTTCEEVIQRYGGHIAQYLGDGLLVYFGYPQAHEDDAHRAVRAGLGMLDALAALNARTESRTGVRLAIRLGIHTGLVVVGEIGGVSRHEQLALLDKLEHSLREYRFAREEMIQLFAALLSVPLPDGRYPPLHLSPQQQKLKTAEALVSWLVETAERQPLLAVWEDLHWADPSTLELLNLVIDQSRTARMLTLLTCRPEFQPQWSPRSHLAHLTLNRFIQSQVERLIAQVMRGKLLPAEVVQQVVAKTDGVPLFVEELLKMILESGLVQEEDERYVLTGPPPPLAIPATLQDSLMARLDRLAPVKEVAQFGAVLGRSFPYELIRAVSPMDEVTLQHGLAQLVDAELLYQRSVPPQATYLFKHALIQDTAYQSLLKSTRQQYHQRIAQVLEAQFPERTAAPPELLAHHYTEAGLNAQAVGYWQKAGQSAVQRSAHVEAISHLTTGLASLKTLPETPERLQREVDMHITLGASLIATKGSASPEVGHTYTRARQLCEHLEAPQQLFPVLYGLWNHCCLRAELHTAHALGEQLLTLAQHVHDAAMLIEAHRAMGQTLLFMGALASASTYLAQGIALADPQQHRALASLYGGTDSGVFCRGQGAWALWSLGYPYQRWTRIDEAVTLAQQLAHPFSLSFSLIATVVFHQLRREARCTQERAAPAMRLAKDQGFPYWMAFGAILHGWALAHRGQAQAGIEQIHQGLRAFRATGAEMLRPHFLALLAEVHGIIGQPEAGLTALAEALRLTDTTSVQWYESELYRLKGTLLINLSSDNQAEAETCFHTAIAIAQNQSTKSWELRAATNLAHLWQQQGKRQEAHDLLTPVYSWFTEGFDTADLQEAKVLLEELEG